MSRGSDKKIPRRVAVFGATRRIGGPLASRIRYAAPDIDLRLITSSDTKQAALLTRFTECECLVAALLEPLSLEQALVGVEEIFVVTPRHSTKASR